MGAEDQLSGGLWELSEVDTLKLNILTESFFSHILIYRFLVGLKRGSLGQSSTCEQILQKKEFLTFRVSNLKV